MMFERMESNAVGERFCHKTGNGFEFVSDDGGMMFSLARNVSALNFQHYIYYMSVVSVKVGGGWVKTNETRVYNSVEDFVKELGRAVGFARAVRDYEDVKIV